MPDFQLYQLLSIYQRSLKYLILDHSLDNSRGSRFEVGVPELLEPFLPQIYIYVRGWGRRTRAVVRGPRAFELV